MSAAARAFQHPPAANAELTLQEPTAPSLAGVTLTALLATVAGQRPSDILFSPPGNTPPQSWTEVAHAARWITRMLLTVTRDQPATVLLPMALDHRAMTAILACLQAGMTPMLVRPDLDVDRLTAKADQIGATLAIGASPDGQMPTLARLREMAARSFGMRCVAGFGEGVPDGVVPLDRLMRDFSGIANLPDLNVALPSHGLGALFIDGELPVVIGEPDLLIAAFDIARALRVEPQARVVTAMTGGSLAALASSLGLAVIAGAELVPLGLFSLTGLWSAFASGRPVHLVMPAAIEDALLASGMLAHRGLASIAFIHRAAPPERASLAAISARIHDIGPVAPSRLIIRQRN